MDKNVHTQTKKSRGHEVPSDCTTNTWQHRLSALCYITKGRRTTLPSPPLNCSPSRFASFTPQTILLLWPELLLPSSGLGAAVRQSAAPVGSKTMCATVKTLKIWTHNGPPPRLAAVSH